MRRRRFLVALTIFVLTLDHAHAQTTAGYLPMADLPLVETSETEIGFLKSLIGSAQIFLTPSTFGEYWPDYGYSWMDVRGGPGCDSLSAVQGRSKVGTVALVMPKAPQSSEYIGLDLTDRISLDTIEDRGVPNPVTLQRLCAWLSHENSAQIEDIEDYVRRASDLWSMEGSWTPVDINLNEEYRFIGIGEIVAEAEPDSIGWKLPNGRLLEWEIPQPVESSNTELEPFDTDESRSGWTWGYDSDDDRGPIYYLMPTSGSTNPRQLQQFNLSVDDQGMVTSEDFPVEAGTTFTLWAADEEQSRGHDWWLITEHTLRSPEFTVGKRVTDYR